MKSLHINTLTKIWTGSLPVVRFITMGERIWVHWYTVKKLGGEITAKVRWVDGMDLHHRAVLPFWTPHPPLFYLSGPPTGVWRCTWSLSQRPSGWWRLEKRQKSSSQQMSLTTAKLHVCPWQYKVQVYWLFDYPFCLGTFTDIVIWPPFLKFHLTK